MPFDPSTVNKKVQYLTVDSEYIVSSNTVVNGYSMGGNNNFTVNFGTSSSAITSNIFVQELRNVIGIKLVDFYVTQIASCEQNVSNTSPLAVKYIDILCPDLPDQAQILDERKSKIFARIPLERDFSSTGPSNVIVNDKQWKSFTRQTNFFNPLSIKQLSFQLWELTGQNTVTDPYGPGTYQPLQPDANFYMVLEVTTVDYDAITLPKEDPNVKVVEAIEALGEKITALFENLPGPQEPVIIEKIVQSVLPSPSDDGRPESKGSNMQTYIIIALVAILVAYLFMK
jgi:hypothetical protein